MISSFFDLVLSIRNLIFGDATIEAKAPTSGAGNSLTLKGSDAASGNTAGGNITITPGLKSGSGADGNVSVTRGRLLFTNDGTTALPTISNNGSTNTGIYFPGTNQIAFVSNGTQVFQCSSAYAKFELGVYIDSSNTLKDTGVFAWSSTSSSFGTVDTGIARTSAGVARISNGSTGTGSLLSTVLVEANTAGSGSPNILLGSESKTVLTNEASTAQNYHTLPTAAAGYVFDFIVQDSDGMRIVASTGDTIRDVATVSTTAGYIQSTTVGSTLRLVAINATEWIVFSKQGTWTIDS